MVILVARLPYLVVLFIFVLFTFTWRTFSTLYIDLTGPVYSSQLERVVGPGSSTVVQTLSYFATLAPFLFIFRPDAMQKLAQLAPEPARRRSDEFTAGDAIFYLSLAFVVLLYFELVRIGIVPLVEGMERFDYTNKYASFAHVLLFEKGNLLAFVWGAVFAYTWIVEERFDLRIIGLVLAIFVYAFVTGNRFSAFYSVGSFFLSPLGAVMVLIHFRETATAGIVRMQEIMRSNVFLAGVLMTVLTAVLVAIGMYNNLVNVRGYTGTEAVERFKERSLIQPSEMWWVTYERIYLTGNWQPQLAYQFLFVNPIDAERNTTPQLLMSKAISSQRTYRHILSGFQFAGGFPEVFFELFGKRWAWPMLFFVGLCSAVLMYIVLRSIIIGALATAFLAQYVLYGLLVMYIGGMLNFILPWTYWVKIVALIIALTIEWGTPVKIVPWRLFQSSPKSLPSVESEAT